MAPFSIASLCILFIEGIKSMKRGKNYSNFKLMQKLIDAEICLEMGWTNLLSNEQSLSNSIAKINIASTYHL